MIQVWRGLARRFRALGHPSSTRLVDWIAGELDVGVQASTTRHVLTCPRCQKEAERIRGVLARSSATLDWTAAPPPADHAARRFPELLRDRALVRAAEVRYRQERAVRLAAALRPYLGNRPMTLLERGDSVEFVSQARRLAEIFLGRQAAAALTDVPDLEAVGSGGQAS